MKHNDINEEIEISFDDFSEFEDMLKKVGMNEPDLEDVSEEIYDEFDEEEFDDEFCDDLDCKIEVSEDEINYDYPMNDDCCNDKEVITEIGDPGVDGNPEDYAMESCDKNCDKDNCKKKSNQPNDEILEGNECLPYDEDEMPCCNKKGKSIMDLYEARKNRPNNKIVESLLVDDTVSNIEQCLKSILDAHGISKAQSVITIGLILDRMLKASDDEVAAPEFLDQIINELVETDDMKDVVKKAVEDALEGKDNPAPGLVDSEPAAVINGAESAEDEATVEVITGEDQDKE